jgi:CRISPR system Cascade subunit CasE
MSLFLSRLRLRRDAATAALRQLFLPDDEDERIATGHRLVWSLFADAPDRKRDFLWREGEEHSFMVLSARPPLDTHRLFALETQEFAPRLSPGDRLGFVLRANATTSAKPSAGDQRGERIDIVMAALTPLAKGEARSRARGEFADREGRAWLLRQSAKSGFSANPEELCVSGYRVHRLPRRRVAAGPGRVAGVTLGVLDLEGVLTIVEPVAFLAAMAAGFGRAKAFGCGLMLVRRLAG